MTRLSSRSSISHNFAVMASGTISKYIKIFKVCQNNWYSSNVMYNICVSLVNTATGIAKCPVVYCLYKADNVKFH